MAIDAVIMAGGAGVRLHPLTLMSPKPLMPLLGKPTMAYALELLARHSVTNAAVTLQYRPQQIRQAFGREYKGVQLHYFEEITPLGTAGSVRLCACHAADSFFILSGDGLTDVDLSEAMRYHKQKGALATLVLTRVTVPLPYGVVEIDGAGRITGFLEKPRWQEVTSDLVNTGIYILEKEALSAIPKTGKPDFGRDVFPALLKKGAPLYGYETTRYWCDIGSPKALLSAQEALIKGKVKLDLPERIAKDAQVAADAKIDEYSYILSGARVEAGAVITRSVVGQNAFVGSKAYVEGALLMERSAVCAGATAQGAILAQEARLFRQSAALPGSVLGEGSNVLRGARVLPNVRINAHITLPELFQADADVMDDSAPAISQIADGFRFSSPVALCRIAGALALCFKEMMVFGAAGQPMVHVLLGALSGHGVRVHAGYGPRLLAPALSRGHTRPSAYVMADTLYVYDAFGLPLSDKVGAQIVQRALKAQAPPVIDQTGGITIDLNTRDAYLAFLPKPDGHYVRLQATQADVAALLPAQKKIDGDAPCVKISGDNTYTLYVSGKPLPRATTALLCLKILSQSGAVYDQEGLPSVARTLFHLLPDAETKRAGLQYAALHDGVLFARLLNNALNKTSPDALLKGLPETYVMHRTVPIKEEQKSSVLSRIRQDNPAHCLTYKTGQGDVHVAADNLCAQLRITAEAARYEFADELCGRIERKILDGLKSNE